jgi:cell division septation protein DedD
MSAFVQPVETDSGRRYRVRVGPVADRAARRR